MKKNIVAVTVVVGCLALAGAAFADNGRGNQRGNGSGDNRDDARSNQVDVLGDGDSGQGNNRVHGNHGRQVAATVNVGQPAVPVIGPQCRPQSPDGRRGQAHMRRGAGQRGERCDRAGQPANRREACNNDRARGNRERGNVAGNSRTDNNCSNNNGNNGAGGRVHDDNGHGNDAGHTDPSNPGNGRGNHGTKTR